jgi:hypothetical protein
MLKAHTGLLRSTLFTGLFYLELSFLLLLARVFLDRVQEVAHVPDNVLRGEMHLVAITQSLSSGKKRILKNEHIRTLAIGERMTPSTSPRHSFEPFNLRMYTATSSRTVPRRSEGMIPRGPSTRPSLGVIARMSAGVARTIVGRIRPFAT